MNHLIGQRQLVIKAVEVADRGMQIHRLDRIATGKMNAVEILGQLDEIAVAFAVAHASAALDVRAVGRRGNIAEYNVIAANYNAAVLVARGQSELRGCQRHLLHHEIPAHAH